MSRYADRAQVAEKIEWEGGLWETLEYGMRSTDMPEGDTELIAAWAELESAFAQLKPIASKVESLLEAGDE